MRETVGKYVSQYVFVLCLFCVAVVLERKLALSGLSLWVTAYMILRKVSFKTVFVLGILTDLISTRSVGMAGILLSALLFTSTLIPSYRRLLIWVSSLVGIGVLLSIGGTQLNVGFALVSALFLPIFLLNLRRFNKPNSLGSYAA